MLFILAAWGCQSPDTGSGQMKASLRFDWFTSMTFSGEVLGADLGGQKYHIDIRLEPGSETTDPVKLVLSGANDFGCISVDKFLVANEKGANLVALGVINQLSPAVFVSRKSANIRSPKDWAGKKVGVLPGGATTYVYRSLLNRLSLNPANFHEITVPFDLGTFAAGQYDVRPAFIYDEPVSLQLQGIPCTVIEPKDYGVRYVGRVYFAKRDLVQSQPKLVQAFVSAMADGWSRALANPVAAVHQLRVFEPSTDTVRALISLKKAVPYFYDRNRRVLTFNRPEWQGTIKDLKLLGVIKNTNFTGEFNETFITQYYKSQ